ncbi:MAG: hypothetical protein R2911_27465 [Caldilineaceae bacterium]
MAYVRMIRTGQDLATLDAIVGPVVDAHPGDLWILGNEPDRDTQDGRTPDAYAEFYHAVYTFLKARDPTAQVAIGGVVQATPLRLRYLDMVLSAYQALWGAAARGRFYGPRLCAARRPDVGGGHPAGAGCLCPRGPAL